MSAITRSFTSAIAYAITQCDEKKATYKVYVRGADYLVASPGSDKPDNSRFLGSVVWTDEGSKWVQSNAANEST